MSRLEGWGAHTLCFFVGLEPTRTPTLVDGVLSELNDERTVQFCSIPQRIAHAGLTNSPDLPGLDTVPSFDDIIPHVICGYCCTDWDCAVRPSCPRSAERYAYFLDRGCDPRRPNK